MTEHFDHRNRWVRQRTFDLQQAGMRYAEAREQAEAEFDAEDENGHNGNGNGAA